MSSWIGDQAIEEARLQLGHDRFHPEGAVAGKPMASDRLRFQINRRVMKNEDRAVGGRGPLPRCFKVARRISIFAHSLVGEEAIGCLCAGPVLAGQRYRSSEPGIHAPDQLTKPAVQPAVAGTASRKLFVKLPFRHDLPCLVALWVAPRSVEVADLRAGFVDDRHPI